MRNLFLSILIVGVGYLALVEPVFAQRSVKPGATWAADESLLSQLGTVEAFEEFTVRPPKGYRRVDMPVRTGR